MNRMHGSNKRGRTLAAGAMIACVSLASVGCNNAGQGALTGGALGAGSGAIIGSMFGKAGKGALIGAAAGAVGGAVLGDQNQKADQRSNDRYQYNR